MKRSMLVVTAVVVAMSGMVGLGVWSRSADRTGVVAAAGSTDWIETFTDPVAAQQRFVSQLHTFGGASSWHGDHDMACGAPTTSRTVNLPAGDGPSKPVGETMYFCKDHMMTSYNGDGYAQIDFSPNGAFDGVSRVCWDQNMTELGDRKWTQFAVVPESTFQARGRRLDYIEPGFEFGPGAQGVAPLPSDVFMFKLLRGSTQVYNGTASKDENFLGFTTSDKARRFRTCVTDLDNGTVRVELERESTTETRIQRGSIPNGAVRVIFQDVSYNPPKSAPSTPTPFTWHWDNIIITSGSTTAPPASPTGAPPLAPVTPSIARQYDSLPPVRLLDTRSPLSTIDWQYAGSGPLQAQSVTPMQVAGRGRVGTGARAVSLNVTVVNARANGYATVFPCGGIAPTASNLNFAAGQTVANGVISALDAQGRVCVYASEAVDLLIDVTGFMPVTADFQSASPLRFLDTRSPLSTFDGSFAGGGAAAAGAMTEVAIAGRGPVPATSTAVALNVTAVDAAGAGFATVFPCGEAIPNASNLNFVGGETVPNSVLTKIGANGRVCIYTYAPTHLLVDVIGWFPDADGFDAGSPARYLDTRAANTTFDAAAAGQGIRPAGSVTEVSIGGRGGVPQSAGAAAINLTVTETGAPGYATVFPCGTAIPNASSLNYGAADAVSNEVIARLGEGGKICVYTYASANLIVDVAGWFPG